MMGEMVGKLTWTDVTAGSYELTAQATDDEGAVTTSSSVNVTIQDSNSKHPTCSLVIISI